MQAEASAPTAAGERHHILDALRGWALLGILLANIMVFGGYVMMAPPSRAQALGAAFDPLAELVLETLITGKFYSLFSLLFGIGFALQIANLEKRGEGAARYLRRLALLFGFGLFHLYFLWLGDILALYALMGGALLLFRRASDKSLLQWAVLLWLLPIAWSAMIHLGGIDPSGPLFGRAFAGLGALGVDPADEPITFYRDASFATQFAAHPAEVWFRVADLTYQLRPAKVLAMFLIGLWVGRRLLPTGLDAAAPLLRRVAKVGIGVGLPLSLARTLVLMSGSERPALAVVEEAFYCLGTPLLALGYGAAFALAWRSRRKWLGWSAPAGRMALTNYLGQSLIQSILFYGWGFGLIGRFGLVFMPAIAALIFIGQVAFSRWWLARFQFGPMEWLWRSLTYGRAQPMRLARPEGIAAA